MNVLLTGPSGSGKTTLARQFAGVQVVQLDDGPAGRRGIGEEPGLILFEGMPTGADREVSNFLGRMDLVLCIEAAWHTRLVRCLRRDGPSGMPRWLWNELCWRRVTRPLVQAHPKFRHVRWGPELVVP